MDKIKKQHLEILFECWKNGNNTKEWLELITTNLPKLPPLKALSVMRKMAKTDEQWLRAANRKTNKKEKEKKEKQKEKENKRAAAVAKREEREEKRAERDKKKEQSDRLNNIKENLTKEDVNILIEKIGIEYFFCSDLHQYVNNISCIFKLFSNEYKDSGNNCENCLKMNKHIPLLEEIVNGREKIGKYRASEGRSEITEENTTTGSESFGKAAGNN